MSTHIIRSLALLFFCHTVQLQADIRLPALISDHMVLVRSRAVPIWGNSDPGETVTVAFDSRTSQTVAGADGRWKVLLNLENTGPGPFQMTVKGQNEIVVSDVVVGAVWLAAGQSNMELPLQATLGAEAEIARSGNSLLRVFRVVKVGKPQPVEDCKGQWVPSDPKSSPAFTAVGYYFAQRIQRELRQPVGLIDGSWSGTYSEMWMSEGAIRSVESIRTGDARRRQLLAEYPALKKKFVDDYAVWLETNGRKDRPSANPAGFLSSGDWSTIRLPGKISERPVTGAVWIRKEIEVPAEALTSGQAFKVLLGDIEGFEQVYWNGTKVSETSYQSYPGAGYPRYFPVPPNLLHEGNNTIAVRIFAPALPPKITNAPGRFWAFTVNLEGTWETKTEYELPLPAPAVLANVPKPPSTPPLGNSSVIFNGTIHPLTNYAIDAVLWYQGESDASRAYEYRSALGAMIADWREKWKRPHLPFYICQLHAYGAKKPEPGESEFAELRESQAAMLKLPGTAMTVLMDMGESGDDHPRNKRAVGERLASLVLAKQFGKNVPYAGPVFAAHKIEGRRIRIQFSHTEGGLSARQLPATFDVNTLAGKTAPLVRNSPQSALEGFTICGDDRRWVWADARIEGNTVLVWSATVPRPIAVRYGWANNPTVNLENGSGLPAAPFRTDDFPAQTAKNHYGATP